MIKIGILLTGIAALILSDPDERVNLAKWISHWAHRVMFEAVPEAIVIAAIMIPWFMLWRAIQRNGSLGAIAATMVLAILANVLIGKVLIVFNM